MTNEDKTHALLEVIGDRLLGIENALKTLSTLSWMHGCGASEREFTNYGDDNANTR